MPSATLGTSTRRADPSEPFCGLVFKVVADEHTGRLVFVRAYSGTLRTGDLVLNPRTGETERVGRVLHVHANRRETTDSLCVGEVAALVGVRLATTGDTLCAPDAPLALAPITFPEPVISVALEPVQEEDRERLVRAVNRLCAEDPTIRATFDEETRDYLLAGLGELHLDILVDRLRSEFGVEVAASAPRVAYRETIRRAARGQSRYKHQSGGHGHFADVRLRVEPLPRGEGFRFRNRAPRVEIPSSFLPAIRAGIHEALRKGVLAGYPVTDVGVTVLGGRSHAVDSAAHDFHVAGSQAFKRALASAEPLLLEPVMELSVATPEEYLGAVMADLGQKRGTITEMETRGPVRHLRAEVPLASLLQYATHLRSQTQGRGTFALEFRRYGEVPERLQKELLEAWAAERQEAGEERIGKRRRKRMRYMGK